MNDLKKLITNLQKAVADGNMTEDFVSTSIGTLAEMGYEYNYETFPCLSGTESFVDKSRDTPGDLAEALLWKLGKWKSYKNFCNKYSDANSLPSKTDVVFYAFGRHLKDRENPIYDQHAIRALWAICGSLSPDEKLNCRKFLMKKNGKWKPAGAGGSAIDCYNIFKVHLNEIAKDGSSNANLDRLLMPLGQAIKKSTDNYSEFKNLCNWLDKVGPDC